MPSERRSKLVARIGPDQTIESGYVTVHPILDEEGNEGTPVDVELTPAQLAAAFNLSALDA